MKTYFSADKLLYTFYEDYFIFSDDKDSRKEKLIKCIADFIDSVLDKKTCYISSGVKFNQEIINDFRRGKFRLTITLPETDLQIINGCAAAIGTSRSNLFRICVFATIMDSIDSGELKYDEQTMNLFNILRNEYNTIMRQLKIKNLEEEKK